MTSNRPLLITLGAICIVLAAMLAFGIYAYLELKHESDARTVMNQETITDLETRLAQTETDRHILEDALTQEQAKTGSFERRISEISGTVGTLQKLAETDPELLAKYSKVYFLNENYVPKALAAIDPEYLVDADRSLEFHAEALPHLSELLEEAEEDGIELRIASSYRSFGTQAALKNGYLVSYGSGANRFSADQGYSEHQLGTTVDFSTSELGTNFTAFGDTEAYVWLTEHAHRYGFILSYPPGNRYYIAEPWHWRFVGEKLARELHNSKRSFYDLDQREINEYLVSLFD